MSEQTELGEFLSYIYGDNMGVAYVAVKSPDADHSHFTQYFFEYPAELPQMVDTILQRTQQFEVYYAPALFITKKDVGAGLKDNVLGSNVYWVEFDGVVPSNLTNAPEPTLRVKSSIDGHEHWYWRSDTFIQPEQLEQTNRTLTYLLGADSSGWDANQILRPIHTRNHKRNAIVTRLSISSEKVNASAFAGLPSPPPTVELPVPESIPEASDVISKYLIPTLVWELFKNGKPEGQRSEGLMSLGYYFAEIGMNDDEIFAMLLNADMRWGKFKDRADQLQRLAEIVSVARVKYPFKDVDLPVEGLQASGLLSFLQTEYHFEWLWEGFLQKNGYLLLVGPSGVGKTQFSLNAGMSLAIGQDFLERKIEAPKRIAFLSLEMDGPDLQFFIKIQASTYNQEQLKLLQENFLIVPVGEPIPMDTPEGQALVEKFIKDNEIEGLMIDSLGSSMNGDISSETATKTMFSWVDHIRKELGVFVWLIHHNRKATGDNKKPNKLSDVYGSMFVTRNATSVFCMWDIGIANTLQLIPLKLRLSPDKAPFNIYRGADLKFTRKSDGITIVQPQPSAHETEEIQLDKPSEFSANEKGFSI